MTDDPQAVLAALKARQAKTVAQMRFDGLAVVLDETLPPRGEQLRVGRDVWDEMQALLPAVEEEVAEADGVKPGNHSRHADGGPPLA